MFLFNILKFLFVLFIFFIVYGLVRFFLLVSREVNRQVKDKDRESFNKAGTGEKTRSQGNGKIIELNEDQYKVE
jgi:preprotein translocase subunit YajC